MDILKDYNIVNEHPKKINALMNKLLEQEKSTRVECFELYEEITNRMQSCIFEMEELSSYNINNNSGSEDASGGADLREAFARLEERLENLKQAKSILENV